MFNNRYLFAVLLMFLSAIGHGATDQVSPDTPRPYVTPMQPQPSQEIFAGLFFPIGGCSEGSYSVERQGSTIVVTHSIHLPALTEMGTCFLEVSIGTLPAGAYVLQWNEQLIADIMFPGVQYLFTYFKTFQVGPVKSIPALSWSGFIGLISLVAALALLAAHDRVQN